MPYHFSLPTTSSISFASCITSGSHPSLPFTVTRHRANLRGILKEHKRLSSQARSRNLNNVLAAFDGYVPYLLALDAGLSDRKIKGEEIEATLQTEIEVGWRSSIAPTVPGFERSRMQGKGLDHEICFVLSTLAYIHTLLARSQVHRLYATMTPSADERQASINAATRHLLNANSLHFYLSNRCNENPSPSGNIPETSSSAQGALASVALAEATLLAVLKDDPWPGVVAQERNENDKDWMIKAPEIPKVRAHLFARLCLGAAEHAGTAASMFNTASSEPSGRIDATLVKYVTDLKRTSRAKACRFFGIDADLGGETGKAIAWLDAGEEELGFAKHRAEGSKLQTLSKFKKDWTEKKEDKKIKNGEDWGNDAGRLEEARIIEALKKKWTKMNDTVNTQIVPQFGPLVANMPSGRDVHSTKGYSPPALNSEILEKLRAPCSGSDKDLEDSEGSSDEAVQYSEPTGLPGAFPTRSSWKTNDSYY